MLRAIIATILALLALAVFWVAPPSNSRQRRSFANAALREWPPLAMVCAGSIAMVLAMVLSIPDRAARDRCTSSVDIELEALSEERYGLKGDQRVEPEAKASADVGGPARDKGLQVNHAARERYWRRPSHDGTAASCNGRKKVGRLG
jgi:hypothetical protein